MLMPWWMQVYTILFILVVISNLIFQLKLKIRKFILLYEFFSAGYMIFLIYVYWTPSIMNNISILNLFALPFIIGVDFYLTIWGKEEELGIKIPEMTKKEFETAKTVSILFAAPAYITGLLLACHVILTK
jgi:hypothetical protein